LEPNVLDGLHAHLDFHNGNQVREGENRIGAPLLVEAVEEGLDQNIAEQGVAPNVQEVADTFPLDVDCFGVGY